MVESESGGALAASLSIGLGFLSRSLGPRDKAQLSLEREETLLPLNFFSKKKSNMPPSSQACDAGANPFIERYFGDCVFDDRDMLGFVAGMLSIACWMVAQVTKKTFF